VPLKKKQDLYGIFKSFGTASYPNQNITGTGTGPEHWKKHYANYNTVGT
jgi:hypothetical protein